MSTSLTFLLITTDLLFNMEKLMYLTEVIWWGIIALLIAFFLQVAVLFFTFCLLSTLPN